MIPPTSNKMDALYFKRLDEVRAQRFDYVVVGAGAYGTAFAHRVLELDRTARVLVLEKGTFLLPEHWQNLPSAYAGLLGTAGITPWVLTSKYGLHPQFPYPGGRALFWNAWIPQPTPSQMPDWPQAVVEGLKREWYETGAWVGRKDAIDIGGFFGKLHLKARERLFAGLARIPSAEAYERPSDLEGTMGTHQTDGVHGWRRFSPVNALMQDLGTYADRLVVVAGCEVQSVAHEKGRVTRLATTQGALDVGRAEVVLASGTVEPTAIALRSFPRNKLIGNNFSGHVRSQVMLRVPRASMDTGSERLEVADLYLAGWALGRQFHTHVSVISYPRPGTTQDDLYRVLPDPTTMGTYTDGHYVYVLLQSLGEIPGERTEGSRNRVLLRDGQTVVQIDIGEQDQAFWEEMEKALFQTAEVLAGGARVEYQVDGTWTPTPPSSSDMRDYNLVHEAGTLWMGDDPKKSVTDPDGRFHDARNLYALGGALFPNCGSWNPTFTGMAMARRLARRLVERRASA